MIRTRNSKEYCFPKLLTGQLAQILNYPLTLVEAPSGFGKTTAVKKHLDEAAISSVCWYTCLGEPANKAWDGICNVVEAVDEIAVRKIKILGVPCKHNHYDMIELLRGICCEQQTVLVIDNYQLIRNEFLDALQYAFSDGFDRNFHIVIVTQPPKRKNTADTLHNPQKLYIDRSYFFFSKEDTKLFFKQSGIHLSEDELQGVWQNTEGWVAALCLQKKNYEQKGSFGNSAGIDELLETAVWNRMSVQEQEFLLSLSLFDRFTLKQSMIMLDTDVLPDYANDFLAQNDFIRYDENSHSYFFHSLLRDYLLKYMEKKKETEYAKRVYLRAGEAYAAVGQNYKAAQCYYEISAFEQLLSLPFKGSDLNDWVGMGSDLFVSNIIRKCPGEVLSNHPQNLIVFAFEMFLLGKYELFDELCRIITQTLANDNKNLQQEQLRWLSGEFLFMTSLTKFNHIKRMSEEQNRAFSLLGGASKLFTFIDGWTMDAPSVLYLFWRESGALQQELQSIDACMPYYYKMTNYHGMGAEVSMRAEALLLAGDDIGAEALCYKALYLADGKTQSSICFCAQMCLLRIALLRGDAALFERVMQNIDKRALTACESRPRYIKALIKGWLFVQLNSADAIESWLLEPMELERYLYIAAVPFGQMIYARYLIASGQYARLIGISELLIDRAAKQGILLARVYQHIYLSIAYFNTNQKDKGAEQLKTAMELALPDKAYLPFAENAHLLGDLLQSRLLAQYEEHSNEIHQLTSRQNAGAEKIKKYIMSKDLGLTPREKEIATLAQSGKTNKEIGALLFISPETVKMTLKKIFSKLGIHSRAQLEATQLK